MFAFSNYFSQFFKIVQFSKFVFENQKFFTCFDKCSKFVQYLEIQFTLSNIAQIFITLFIISKRMIENSEKDRISVFTFFTSLRLLNFSRTRQPERLARMPPELEVRSWITSSVGFFAIFLHRHYA